MLILTIILLVLCGLVLLYAWRGRIVDRHPYCAACRFDLNTRWPDIETCPECGADVQTLRAVRHDRREPRRRLLTGAATFLALAIAMLGSQLFLMARSGGWHEYKPIWILLWEIDVLPANMVNRRVDVLVERMTNKSLSDDKIQSIAEKLHKTEFTMRSRVRAGEEIPVRITIHDTSNIAAKRWFATELVSFQCKHLHIDRRGRVDAGVVGLGGTGSWTVYRSIPNDLSVGEHEATVKWRYAFVNANRRWMNPLYAWTESHNINFTVEPAEMQIVKRVNDSTLKPALRDAIRVTNHRLRGSFPHITIHTSDLPMPVAFEVYLRIADREKLISTFVAKPTATKRIFSPSCEEVQTDATQCDFVFRSSAKAARQHVGINRIWDGELVFEDISVPDQN